MINKKIENKICICMLHYNSSDYIDKAIGSIANQKYTNWFLYVYDDGSEDYHFSKLKDALRKIKGKYKLIEGKHIMQYAARLKIYNLMEGDIAITLDSDDMLIDNDFFGKLNQAFNSDADLVLYNYTQNIKTNKVMVDYLDYNQKFINFNNNKEIQNSFFNTTYLNNIWTKAFSLDLVKYIKSFPNKKIMLAEDRLCSMYLLANASKITIIDKSFYYYRINNNSITQSKCEVEYIDSMLFVENIIKDYCDCNKINNYKYEDIILSYVISILRSYFLSRRTYKDCIKACNYLMSKPEIDKALSNLKELSIPSKNMKKLCLLKNKKYIRLYCLYRVNLFVQKIYLKIFCNINA